MPLETIASERSEPDSEATRDVISTSSHPLAPGVNVLTVVPCAGRLLKVSVCSTQVSLATDLTLWKWPDGSVTNMRSLAVEIYRPPRDWRLNFRYDSRRGLVSAWREVACPKLALALSPAT